MKTKLILLCTFMVMLFSPALHAQKAKNQTVTIKTAIYCNHCKACETCGELFNKKLLKEPGIQMVQLDEKAMTITVNYNSKKTDIDKIRQAITRLGYDADDLKADPKSYAALDGCCKK